MANLVTAERLREVLNYDPATGIFTWAKVLSNKGPVGARAGRVDARGYVAIGIDRRLYKAHRLAWLYMTGHWPMMSIDHIDVVKTNNAWVNLREASQQANTENVRQARTINKTGFLGVHVCAQTGRYRAAITASGKCKQLGRFDTPEQAHLAYLIAKREFHAGSTL